MGILYSKMKTFHFGEKLDSLPKEVDEIKAPIHIRIKPTNVCNHDCYYCAYKVSDLQLGGEMVERDRIPQAKMAEIVEDIIEMGVEAVTFSGGGEPFLYPHLLETVKRLADSPVKFASLSNGSRLHGEIAEVFAHNATWLRISIDGWDDESYAKYRGIKGQPFSKLMQNMAAFKKLGGSCYLGVSLITDRANAPHVFDFCSRLKDTGVDSVKISPCILSNDGAQSNEYHRPIFDLVRRHVDKAKNELEGDGFEVFDAYHELDLKFTKDYKWCPYLQVLPIIGADLNVYSCQDKAYTNEGRIGSIKDIRFKDFWFSDKNKFFNIDPSQHCNHHCVANLKNKAVLEYLETDRNHLGFV